MTVAQGTPRTDAVHKAACALPIGSFVEVPAGHPPCDPWELARELEREVAALSAQVAKEIQNKKEFERDWLEACAQVVELQKELAAKNKPVVCYSNCAMHKNVPWKMTVSVMAGPVATVCPICHPPEYSA